MTEKHLVVGIDWYGPYSLEEAYADAQEYFLGGLYVCIGKQRGQHKLRIQYIGKSSANLHSRMTREHHKMQSVNRERKIWLGEIVTGDVPGKRKTLTPSAVRFSEWGTAYFLNLPLNEKLRRRPPPRPVTILNRWWRRDYETPYTQRPHPDWPDLIDFRGVDFEARIVRFAAPGLRYTSAHIRE